MASGLKLTEQDGRVHARLPGYRLKDGGYAFDLPTAGLAGAVSDGGLELGLRPEELYSVLAVVVDDPSYDQREVDALTRDRVDRHLDDIALVLSSVLRR